ncbi:hypothetical protein KFE98_01860 [bacterium SCSIO 12741]|nr:hypothetical protein KFE98_01860 [bacterium SCSIO 12741]
MKVSVEISKYPLTKDYLEPIQNFIDQLHTYPDIKVETNTMSTQIFGEYDLVMRALQACIKQSFIDDSKTVFSMKILNADLDPEAPQF